MTLFTKLLLERVEAQKKYFANPQKYARKAKEAAQEFFPEVKAFLFGSVLTEQGTASSDIDLLIVSPFVPKKQLKQAEIKAKIYKKIGDYSPFEIHLVTPKGFSWYERFIEKIEEV